MSEAAKCTVRDGLFVEPCGTLSRASEGDVSSGKRKGIVVWDYINVTNGKPSRTMFGVKSGEYNKGILFNHCPFCGEKIDAPFSEEK